jgi:hypothetical protein
MSTACAAALHRERSMSGATKQARGNRAGMQMKFEERQRQAHAAVAAAPGLGAKLRRAAADGFHATGTASPPTPSAVCAEQALAIVRLPALLPAAEASANERTQPRQVCTCTALARLQPCNSDVPAPCIICNASMEPHTLEASDRVASEHSKSTQEADRSREASPATAAAVRGRDPILLYDGTPVSAYDHEAAAQEAAQQKNVRGCVMALVCARVFKVRRKVAKSVGELFTAAKHKVRRLK